MAARKTATARIEYLRVQNYRALRDVELKNLTPMTVLLGPNGSGKSTIFDVFAFLSECFDSGLRRAWDRRGRAKELITIAGRNEKSLADVVGHGEASGYVIADVTDAIRYECPSASRTRTPW